MFSSVNAPISDKISQFTINHLYREVQEKDKDGGDSSKMTFDFGRSWKTDELRLKSSEDLHKLWHVLHIEKNRIFSDGLFNSKELKDDFLIRLKSVKLSMARLKNVVNERKKVRENYRKSLEEDYYKNHQKKVESEFKSKENFN
jgi:large subunit ribosomal protein L47